MSSILRKSGIPAAACALVLAGSVCAQVPSAGEVLNAALAEARMDGKNVLVHFGASWCTWCKRLDALLEGPEFGGLFHDNYVIAHLTIMESADKKALENPGAQQMVDEAVSEIGGVPFYMFFDGDGNRIATSLAMPNGGNIGHPVQPDEIDAFVGLLAKTAPHMTPADRDRIAEYLSKQKY